MKNINYNLLKLLHSKLDNAWRIEKHYLKDAEEANENRETLKMILQDEKKHCEMLQKEIERKMVEKRFN